MNKYQVASDNFDMDSVEFLPDDFEFIGNKPEEHIDSNFASQDYWKDVFIRFKRNKGAVIGFILLVIIAIMAVIGPMVSGYTFDQQRIEFQDFAPRVPGLEKIGIFDGSEVMRGPGGSSARTINKYKTTEGAADVYYWFGTDNLGRDIWTRTWMGTRISLIIAVSAVLIDMAIGMSYGLIAGYFGGWVDNIMQRVLEVVNSIPTLVIVTLLMLVFKPGLFTIILALMVSGWVGMSRIARAQMLKLKEQEFVLASRTFGAGSWHIIFSEVLPNIIGQIITNTMFSIPNAIFTEAFLSFVGLGIPAPQASLGSLISSGYNSFTTHPYQILPPLIVLALLMLCCNMVADGLRDALDPKMAQM